MSTLYIHVGTPKTGTSAIQHFCNKNRKKLKEQGVYYPSMGFEFPGIGVNRNGYFMNHRILGEDKKRKRDEEEALIEKGLEKLQGYLEKYPNVVLSDEFFWNNKDMNAEKWAYYKDKFAEMGADLKIIVYLRRQDLLIQSYWAQQVKETMTMPFQKYIESGKYKFFKVDYDQRLDQIAEGVGKENIIVRVYEKQQYYGGSIISDFLHIFSLELTDEYKQTEKVVNASLEGVYLEVKRLLNFDPIYKNKKNFLVPYLTDLQIEKSEQVGYTKGKYFTKDEQKDFMDLFAAGNERVAREYLGRADGKLFLDEYLTEDNDEAVKYSSKELVLIMGEIVARQQALIEEKEAEIEELKKQQDMGIKSRIKKVLGRG